MLGFSLVAASGGHSSSRCPDLSLSRPLLLRSTGSRRAGSVVVAHGPSCSTACGIFPDQGSNLCPLHWQADSQPLCHQGSPSSWLLPELISWLFLSYFCMGAFWIKFDTYKIKLQINFTIRHNRDSFTLPIKKSYKYGNIAITREACSCQLSASTEICSFHQDLFMVYNGCWSSCNDVCAGSKKKEEVERREDKRIISSLG